MMQFCGLNVACQSVEFTVSQCLDKCVPGQCCPPPPNPLLQDPRSDAIGPTLTPDLSANAVHSTAICIVQKEDPERQVIGADLLRYLESK